MNKESGFSLIEVLLASGLVSLLCLSIAQFLQTEKSYTVFANRSELLRVLLEENAYELETRPIAQVPTVGKCLVRMYDSAGKWLNDQTVDSTASACQDPMPIDSGFYVTWNASSSDDIAVNFTPAAFLKLPKYVSTVRKIRIAGGLRASLAGRLFQVGLTVYKR